MIEPLVIFIVTALIAMGVVRRLWFWRARETPFYREGQLLCLAHRGAPLRAPENTLPAFQEAVEADAGGVELDVMETADGVVVVRHDFDLECQTEGIGYVWNTTYQNLSQLDAAHRWQGRFPRTVTPRLADVLESLPDHLFINIELKSHSWRSTGLEEKVIELVRRYGLVRRTIISSFNPYWLWRVRWLEPELRIGYIWENIYAPWYLRRPYFVSIVRPDLLHPVVDVITKELVVKAHRRGMKVNVWTVNNRPMIEYLRSVGVDGIITDFPELVQPVDKVP